MRTVVTLVAAAAFLLHFALGCCAHHAHAAEGVKVQTDDCCCHHGCNHSGSSDRSHEQEPQDSDDSDCPGHRCTDSQCVFMATGKTVVAKDAFVTALPDCVAVPVALSSNVRPVDSAIDLWSLIALPVRIHLFNQVLLI